MRKLAVCAVLLSILLFLLNIVLYDKIVTFLPVIRGISTEKTVFLSLRILIINILTLFAYLILVTSISRTQQAANLQNLGFWILILLMSKMLFEFVGLFNAWFMNIQIYPLFAGIAALLFHSVTKYTFIYSKTFWKSISFTKGEITTLIFLLLCYIGIHIPVIPLITN